MDWVCFNLRCLTICEIVLKFHNSGIRVVFNIYIKKKKKGTNQAGNRIIIIKDNKGV